MKTRHELPVLKKLNIRFDIDKLKESYKQFVQNKEWDGFSRDYSSLYNSHNSLPPNFFGEKELKNIGNISDVDWKKTSYKQISLTEFDDEFSLEDRKEGSHSKWSKRVVKNNPKADERWFRKIKPNVPDYLQYILNTMEGAHRTKFACLMPNSSIKPHIDFDTTYSIRLHIAIDTNDKCVIGGWDKKGKLSVAHIPADGSVWFLNPGVRHFAENKGNQPRVHLIFSVESQKLLDEPAEKWK